MAVGLNDWGTCGRLRAAPARKPARKSDELFENGSDIGTGAEGVGYDEDGEDAAGAERRERSIGIAGWDDCASEVRSWNAMDDGA